MQAVAPVKLRRTVFDGAHGLAQPSIKFTVKLIMRKFVWHSMEKYFSHLIMVPPLFQVSGPTSLVYSVFSYITPRPITHNQNGLVERWHCTFKSALIARYCGPDWVHHLPWFLEGLRTTPNEGLNLSSAEMVSGDFFGI